MRLSDEFSGILIDPDSSNLATMFYRLILKCLEYEGSLTFFIDTMDELFEMNSSSIQELKNTHGKIFIISPPDALVRVEEEGLVIICQNNSEHFIPNNPPNISEEKIQEIRELRTQIRICKKIHTLCEQLVRDYLDLYRYIITEEFDIAKRTIKEFHNKCVNFIDQLQELEQEELQELNQINKNNRIFLLQPINTLKIIPDCIISLGDTMNFPSQNSYCQLGKNLANRITDLLFEALRLADRILQNYFNSNQLTEGDSNP